jgi:queuine tRNA-ribosyltransferase
MKSGEHLGSMLLSWANVAFYQDLMAAIRKAIAEDRYAAFITEHKLRLSSAEPAEAA